MFIKKDPEGKTWQPVVVPNIALSQGEEMLRKMGYTGKLISASRSPSGGFPCLRTPDGRLLVGQEKIIHVLRGDEPTN